MVPDQERESDICLVLIIKRSGTNMMTKNSCKHTMPSPEAFCATANQMQWS